MICNTFWPHWYRIRFPGGAASSTPQGKIGTKISQLIEPPSNITTIFIDVFNQLAIALNECYRFLASQIYIVRQSFPR